MASPHPRSRIPQRSVPPLRVQGQGMPMPRVERGGGGGGAGMGTPTLAPRVTVARHHPGLRSTIDPTTAAPAPAAAHPLPAAPPPAATAAAGAPRKGAAARRHETIPHATVLPPGLSGEPQAELRVALRRVIWHQRHVPRQWHARLAWWGDTGNKPAVFRPVSVQNRLAKAPEADARRTVALFPVVCGRNEFNQYLRDMDWIVFELHNEDNKQAIGTISIKAPARPVDQHPLSGFFPIVGPAGQKLGEAYVSLELQVTTAGGTAPASVFAAPSAEVPQTSAPAQPQPQPQPPQPQPAAPRAPQVVASPVRTRKPAAQPTIDQELVLSTESRPRGPRPMGDATSAFLAPPARVPMSTPVPPAAQHSVPGPSPAQDVISQLLDRGLRLRNEMAISAHAAGVAGDAVAFSKKYRDPSDPLLSDDDERDPLEPTDLGTAANLLVDASLDTTTNPLLDDEPLLEELFYRESRQASQRRPASDLSSEPDSDVHTDGAYPAHGAVLTDVDMARTVDMDRLRRVAHAELVLGKLRLGSQTLTGDADAASDDAVRPPRFRVQFAFPPGELQEVHGVETDLDPAMAGGVILDQRVVASVDRECGLDVDQWMSSVIVFRVSVERPGRGYFEPVGVAVLPLRGVLFSANLFVEDTLRITQLELPAETGGAPISGSLTVSLCLLPDAAHAPGAWPRGHGSSLGPHPDDDPALFAVVAGAVSEAVARPGAPGTRNLFLVCRGLMSTEPSRSQTAWSTSSPCFNHHHREPVLVGADLLQRLRNNIVAVELWDRCALEDGADELLGIVKLPLHEFYLALHEPRLARSVLDNAEPLVAMNDTLPVLNPYSGVCMARLHLLMVLGNKAATEAYIQRHKAREQHPRSDAGPSRLPPHAAASTDGSDGGSTLGDATTPADQEMTLRVGRISGLQAAVDAGVAQSSSHHPLAALREAGLNVFLRVGRRRGPEVVPLATTHIWERTFCLDVGGSWVFRVPPQDVEGGLELQAWHRPEPALHNLTHPVGELLSSDVLLGTTRVPASPHLASNAWLPLRARGDGPATAPGPVVGAVHAHAGVAREGAAPLPPPVFAASVRLGPDHAAVLRVSVDKVTLPKSLAAASGPKCLFFLRYCIEGVTHKTRPVEAAGPRDGYSSCYFNHRGSHSMPTDDALRRLVERQIAIELWAVRNALGAQPEVTEYVGSFHLQLHPPIQTSQTEQGVFPLSRDTATNLLGAEAEARLSLDIGPGDRPVRVAPDAAPTRHPAQIVVERAMHLPELTLPFESRGTRPQVPSAFVSYQAGPDEVACTQVVRGSSSPIWAHRTDGLLTLSPQDHTLEFKVWHHDEERSPAEQLLGVASVDLTLLGLNLTELHGWYHIINAAGEHQGQLLVHVVPRSSLRGVFAAGAAAGVSLHRPLRADEAMARLARSDPGRRRLRGPAGRRAVLDLLGAELPASPGRPHTRPPVSLRPPADTVVLPNPLLDELPDDASEAVLRRRLDDNLRDLGTIQARLSRRLRDSEEEEFGVAAEVGAARRARAAGGGTAQQSVWLHPSGLGLPPPRPPASNSEQLPPAASRAAPAPAPAPAPSPDGRYTLEDADRLIRGFNEAFLAAKEELSRPRDPFPWSTSQDGEETAAPGAAAAQGEGMGGESPGSSAEGAVGGGDAFWRLDTSADLRRRTPLSAFVRSSLTDAYARASADVAAGEEQEEEAMAQFVPEGAEAPLLPVPVSVAEAIEETEVEPDLLPFSAATSDSLGISSDAGDDIFSPVTSRSASPSARAGPDNPDAGGVDVGAYVPASRLPDNFFLPFEELKSAALAAVPVLAPQPPAQPAIPPRDPVAEARLEAIFSGDDGEEGEDGGVGAD